MHNPPDPDAVKRAIDIFVTIAVEVPESLMHDDTIKEGLILIQYIRDLERRVAELENAEAEWLAVWEQAANAPDRLGKIDAANSYTPAVPISPHQADDGNESPATGGRI